MSIKSCFVRSCLTALFASPCAMPQAASLQVAPVSVEVPAPGAAATLKLRNEGNRPLDAQIRIFQWTQVDGVDTLTPTNDVAASPPLASLRANIQTLEQAERLQAEDREGLRRDIVAELDELTSLVSDVVELARGAKSGESERDDMRLDEIVADAIERTRRRGDRRFQVELEPTVIRGEPDRVSRAVSNLLDNARKWSPTGGLIEVVLKDGVLSVRDHGPGFPEQDLANVFERFYRAEEARKLPGSGLGLAIVRQAAEAHRGYARAENAPGGGARLEVSFGAPLSS